MSLQDRYDKNIPAEPALLFPHERHQLHPGENARPFKVSVFIQQAVNITGIADWNTSGKVNMQPYVNAGALFAYLNSFCCKRLVISSEVSVITPR